MQLRYFIYAVLFLVLSFILNISFYIFIDSYREFLKNLKQDNVKDNNILIQQESVLKNNENNLKTKNENITNKKEISYINDVKYPKNTNKNEEKNLDLEELKVEYKSIIDIIKETKIEKEFLNRFKEYKLKKLELHPRLFDLTTEYPDEYIEYYSEYLTLYFFGNKPYSDLKDIFQVLTYELPFTINEVNNFGDKSFYINLKDDFQDGQVRIVLSYKNRTFGLKMSKDIYPLIKEKLNRLK